MRTNVVYVRRADWDPCSVVDRGGVKGRLDDWLSSDVQQVELWRIEDGKWSVDVRLGEYVRYETARSIVLAIRRSELLDRRVKPYGIDVMPVESIAVRAGEIEAIRMNTKQRIEAGDGVPYDVVISEGGDTLLLRLRVRNRKFELLEMSLVIV